MNFDNIKRISKVLFLFILIYSSINFIKFCLINNKRIEQITKNKEIIFSGMIASMIGIALGNFCGVGLAKILQLL